MSVLGGAFELLRSSLKLFSEVGSDVQIVNLNPFRINSDVILLPGLWLVFLIYGCGAVVTHRPLSEVDKDSCLGEFKKNEIIKLIKRKYEAAKFKSPSVSTIPQFIVAPVLSTDSFGNKAKRKKFKNKMVDPNLVTTCNFNGQEFLFKMNVFGNTLEILLTDKNSGEEWQCNYDATYIENLTHKTGNFKQFNIFVTMIKSGLLRTSECVSLDLLSFEDLEMLRSRKITKVYGQNNNNNRRYLIVTYCVEFDKIRYPLALEYCGPPDPIILQATIKRLKSELDKTREELQTKSNYPESKKIQQLQKKVDNLLNDNERLREDNIRLRRELAEANKTKRDKPRNQVLCLQRAMEKLEKSVLNERNSHHELVEKLKSDKTHLRKELDQLKWSEKSLRTKLREFNSPIGVHQEEYLRERASPCKKESNTSINTMYRREISPVIIKSSLKHFKDDRSRPSSSGRSKRVSRRDLDKIKSRSRSSSFGENEASSKSRNQSPALSRTSRCSSTESRSSKASSKLNKAKYSDTEFQKLEAKIESLQKMLKINFTK